MMKATHVAVLAAVIFGYSLDAQIRPQRTTPQALAEFSASIEGRASIESRCRSDLSVGPAPVSGGWRATIRFRRPPAGDGVRRDRRPGGLRRDQRSRRDRRAAHRCQRHRWWAIGSTSQAQAFRGYAGRSGSRNRPRGIKDRSEKPSHSVLPGRFGDSETGAGTGTASTLGGLN